MVERDKRGGAIIRPVLLKLGVALAFSLGGVLYTLFSSKRIKPSGKPKPSQGDCSQAESRKGSSELRNSSSQDLPLPKISSQNSSRDLSHSGRCSGGDRESFLLPELDYILAECNMAATTVDVSHKQTRQSLEPEVDSQNEHKCEDHEECDREISMLRNKVEILEERERMMEIQLLEYYGLKEQEAAVIELQNQLRLNNMEAKLYSLKIESLQSDKKRLEAQLSDYAKVVSELEAAKAKIKLLRKKLSLDAEQNRDQILSLQERVMKLRDPEVKVVEIDRDVATKELEGELEEMKKLNDNLKMENSELARRLEYVQMLATSALDDEEIQQLKEESHLLRQQNEDLRKEIEQLHADRYTDLEQLVYLRWINACLRYELRNYQPGPGKTMARDLSKTLSPKSEERAKQLILEYANKEGTGDINLSDFDSDQLSTSHTSYFTDSGEPDDSTFSATRTNHPSKSRIFTKLMKLLRGEDNHHSSQASSLSPERDVSMDDLVGRYRHSFDLQRSYSHGQKSSNTGESSKSTRRASDDGSLGIFRRIGSLNDYDSNLSPTFQPPDQDAAKTELVKYAEALKKSRAKSSRERRAASCSAF